MLGGLFACLGRNEHVSILWPLGFHGLALEVAVSADLDYGRAATRMREEVCGAAPERLCLPSTVSFAVS